MSPGSLPLEFDQAYQNAIRYNGQYPKVVRSITAGQIFRLPEKTQNEEDTGSLTSSQRSLSIGDPVPIVFARRVGSNGGILISPGATEARFGTTVEYAVVIEGIRYQIVFVLDTSYHLVLSEGVIDSIPVKDVFQGVRRTGTYTQTYSRRAGTWIPGNFVNVAPYDSQPTPECPVICGSIGLYPEISTLSFSVSTRYGRTDSWKHQVHVFIRGGMYVTRLLDNVFGPSNNFADLIKWAMLNIKRISTAAIDNTSLLEAAQFLDVNQFTCNAYFDKAVNYEALTEEWAPYFLLQSTRNNGKEGLRSLLPLNANGTLNTGPIEWSYTFDESLIVPGSLEINYTPLTERLPFIAQVIWRQQPDSDVGITRTLEVNYNNLALDGPYEKHDISAFCTNENHAAKVGAYIVSTRANVSHTLEFTAAPGSHSYLLNGGDIIRVILNRTASGSADSRFIYLYRIVQVIKDVAGSVSYSCVHFPVDSQGRSVVALDVNSAVGGGYIMSSRSGLSSDEDPSRKNDNTIPPESYILRGSYYDPSSWGSPNYQWYKNGVAIPGETGPTYTPTPSDIGETLTLEVGYPDGTTATSGPIVVGPEGVGTPLSPSVGDPSGTGPAGSGGNSITVGSGGGNGGTGGAVSGSSAIGDVGGGNPSDGLGLITAPAITGTLVAGNTLSYDPGCPGAFIEWRLVTDATGEYQVVSSGVAVTYLATEAATAAGVSVVGVGRCPDPSAPGGYGPEIISPPAKVQFNPALYLNFRWTGTLRKRTNFGTGPLSDIPITSGWRSTGNSNYGYIILRGFTGSPSTFVTLNSGPWGANLAFYLDGTAGFSGSSCGYVQDNNSGGSINYMQEFGGFVAQEQNGNLAFEATNGKWQFSNVQSPSNNTIPIAEWGGA